MKISWKIWVFLASKTHENVIPFATRNFRKFGQMQNNQGLELPCGHVFNSVCCVLSCRFRRKIETARYLRAIFRAVARKNL